MIAGKYVLDRVIGQGGMGAVYSARHLKLSKAVAIKVMLADTSNPEASQRFINEGRAAANIQNEHVVRVDDVDEEMGYAYMVLELLEGKDLSQILDADPAKKIAPHVVVGWVIQALRGVTQAHALGIVHRDLKPSNLFLAKRKDGTDVVKVLDFGISKTTGNVLGQAPNALTSTKAMLGSPLYMSPEQLRNAKGVDHRADIWAIGIILYELMTGALPFMGDNLGELFAAILESDPQPMSARVQGIPPGLDEVVLHCLARKPEGRFQSVGELANALAPFERATPMSGHMSSMPQMAGTAFMAVTPPASGSQNVASTTGPNLPPNGAITPPNQFLHAPQLGSQPGNQQVPPGFNQSGSGWQAGPVAGVPKSKAPIIAVIIFAAMAMIGLVTIVFVKLRAAPPDDSHVKTTNAGSASAPPATVTVPPPALPSATVTATATAEPTVSATPPPELANKPPPPSGNGGVAPLKPPPPGTTTPLKPPPTATGKPVTPQMENAR